MFDKAVADIHRSILDIRDGNYSIPRTQLTLLHRYSDFLAESLNAVKQLTESIADTRLVRDATVDEFRDLRHCLDKLRSCVIAILEVHSACEKVVYATETCKMFTQ